MRNFAWARELIWRGGRPIGEGEIWVDTYGNRPGRNPYPLGLAGREQLSARFLLRDRGIFLRAIYLESIISIRR